MQNEPLSKDIDGIFKYSDNIVSKVNFLEENPEFKNKIIENGKDYILEKFNKNKVGDMWTNFINSLLNG
jgi:glycosyltransferase involved in cell wall biosynthesis